MSIPFSYDAIEDYVRQYEVMVAARHMDLEQMRSAYAQTKSLVLTIDGLQPEKGHETLYVVRELNQKRVWFAEPLLSSTNDEVRRVLARAGQIARALGLPVVGWMSDKQDAFGGADARRRSCRGGGLARRGTDGDGTLSGGASGLGLPVRSCVGS